MPDATLSSDRLIDIASGAESIGVQEKERRGRQRVPYEALAALILIDDNGRRSSPLVLPTRDISLTGVSVISRGGIREDSRGAMQLVRSDGRRALVGVIVRYCRYVGDMQHHAGMEFAPLPAGLSADDFLDSQGRLCLLDPLLEENDGA